MTNSVDALRFKTTCKTAGCIHYGRRLDVVYRREEFRGRLNELLRDVLRFYCRFCNQETAPTLEEKVNLGRKLTSLIDAT